MDEDDLIARLSHALDTQSVSLTDEGASTKDLLGRLADQIAEIQGDAQEAETQYSDDLGNPEDYFDYDEEDLPVRPTPYQVWKRKQTNDKPTLRRRVLGEQQWDTLVQRLHGTKKSKDALIKQQQNKELADELRELKFQPTLNEKSMQLAANTGKKPMLQRMGFEAQEKERYLQSEREKKLEEEVKDLRAQPEMPGMKTSEKILRTASGGEIRTIEDVLQYGEDAKLRRLQRKQILDELESRELTFRPQLNRTSMILQGRARREGRKDNRRVVKGGEGTSNDPGHEEEVFQPKISERAASYKSPHGKNVHQRLYAMAQSKHVARHNEQVELLAEHTKGLYLKPYEITPRDPDAKGVAGWIQKRPTSKDRAEEAEKARRQIHVFEYSPAFDFILEKLQTSDV